MLMWSATKRYPTPGQRGYEPDHHRSPTRLCRCADIVYPHLPQPATIRVGVRRPAGALPARAATGQFDGNEPVFPGRAPYEVEESALFTFEIVAVAYFLAFAALSLLARGSGRRARVAAAALVVAAAVVAASRVLREYADVH